MGVNKKAIKAMFPSGKFKILRGDKVVITAGKDKGQTGIVSRVIRDVKIPRVIVEGRNLNKRAIKRTADNPGGLVSVESPLHYSNVMIADPVTGGPVRVTWRYLEDGTKVRVTKGKLASGSVVPRPEILKQRRVPLPLIGQKDTPSAEALKQTYTEGDWPSALLRQYSTATHPCGYREAQGLGPRGAQRSLLGGVRGLWRGFSASAVL
ncbi:g6661 [Coccomyxa elongata]